jgi:hypothetical protein
MSMVAKDRKRAHSPEEEYDKMDRKRLFGMSHPFVSQARIQLLHCLRQIRNWVAFRLLRIQQ